MASPDAIERGLSRSSSPRQAQLHDREKIEIESIASNEEPIPTLEPPPHHHHTHHGHGDGDDANTPGGNFKYEYLTFDTDVSLPGLDLHKYHSALSWTATHKTIILVLCCLCTFFAAYSAGSYSIASTPQRAKWNLSAVAFNTGVTAWAVGFALSPMFLAPFSEINGRRPVFLASAVIFLLGLIVCATTPTFAGMLVGRVLVGVGASSFSTMIGGVLSDMYTNEDRNTPMSLFSGAALAGTGAGPLCSGVIVSHVSFRWVYLHQVIGVGCLLVVVYFFFEETRGSVLLSRKARVINEYLEKTDHEREHDHDHDHEHDPKKNASPNDNTPEDPEKPKPKPNPSLGGVPTRLRYKVAADESRSSFAHMLYLSLTIPFKLLFTEPVVFFFSLWTAFAWALLYMTFSVIPLVFSTRHGFDTEQSAAVFASITIGSILATIVCVFQERVAKQYWPKLTTSPEGRLYFACLEAALLPVGLFWFGWTTFSSVHWISPVLALGCAQIGIFVIYLAVFNYLADVYHRYASSALAAQGFARNMFAAVFPLFTDQMFRRLGYPGASSLLGGIAALLTLVPWVLLFNGEKIRARSKIARQIMSTEHRR